MNDTESFPRSSGWDTSLKNSMEECNKEEPSTSSQAPGYCPGKVPESCDLEKILQESPYRPERTPPNPDPKTPPLPLTDLGQPRKSPLTGTDKKYPLMRQRGFYSDILSPGTLDELGVSMVRALASLDPPMKVPFTHLFVLLSVSSSVYLPDRCYPSIHLPTHLAIPFLVHYFFSSLLSPSYVPDPGLSTGDTAKLRHPHPCCDGLWKSPSTCSS